MKKILLFPILILLMFLVSDTYGCFEEEMPYTMHMPVLMRSISPSHVPLDHHRAVGVFNTRYGVAVANEYHRPDYETASLTLVSSGEAIFQIHPREAAHDRVVINGYTEFGGFAYLYYTHMSYNGGTDHLLEIIRVKTTNDGYDLDSSTVVYSRKTSQDAGKVTHPYGDLFNDGNYLFISVGDWDDQGNPDLTSQDLTNPYGSVLRIDTVSENGLPGCGEGNYSIPDDNPYIDVDGACPEIFAYGLRHPWRVAEYNGGYLIADTGWHDREEVSFLPNEPVGQNFGWPCMEGSLETGICDVTSDMVNPVNQYSQGLDFAGNNPLCAITSVVTFGNRIFVSDYCSTSIYEFTDHDSMEVFFEIPDDVNVTDMEVINDKIYVLTLEDGVWIVPIRDYESTVDLSPPF